MDIDLTAQAPTGSSWAAPRVRAAVAAGLAVVLLVVGYLAGAHRSNTKVLTGQVHVGDRVATITADDIAYGFRDSIPWYDRQGGSHEGGWPDCLGSVEQPGVSRVTFAVSRVDLPDGSGAMDQIFYVDCRP